MLDDERGWQEVKEGGEVRDATLLYGKGEEGKGEGSKEDTIQ